MKKYIYENHNHFWMSNGGTNVEHTPKQTKLKDQRDREQIESSVEKEREGE